MRILVCALLYAAQMCSGDDQTTCFHQAIIDYGDCFYSDGAQVGSLATFLLARAYLQQGDKDKATKLFEDLMINYPEATTHSGLNLVSILDSELKASSPK